MTTTDTIARRAKDGLETDFHALRKQGITWLQALAGDNWTDFNLHDPGVTILEQLCFALTDMDYRGNFNTADYLIDEAENLDHKGLALCPQKDTVFSRATTPEDYRTIILDAVPELDNLRITPLRDNRIKGLYEIAILLNSQIRATTKDDVMDSVRNVFLRTRNLGEDIEKITIIREIPCFLFADVEITSRRSPASIMAEIYARTAEWICPTVTRLPREAPSSDASQSPFEQEGPYTQQLIQCEPVANPKVNPIQISDIPGIIASVEGVVTVLGTHLYYEHPVATSDENTDREDSVFRLNIPENDLAVKVRLLRSGKPIPVRHADLLPELEKYRKSNHRQSIPLEARSQINETIAGVRRDLHISESVQNLFPATYGIGAIGLPRSASLKRKAVARQLKGYLLLFEQLLANHMSSISHTKDLFCAKRQNSQSYFCQPLNEPIVPDAPALWGDNQPQTIVPQIVQKFDNCHERNGRVLDYLLALHGEKFTQNSLRHFNFYEAPGAAEAMVNQNKRRMILQIAAINRNRAAGYDFSRDTVDYRNVSGLRRKTSLLLGISAPGFWLTDSLRRRRIALISDAKFEQEQSDAKSFVPVMLDIKNQALGDTIQHIPCRSMDAAAVAKAFKSVPGFTFPRKLGETVLKEGVFPENYFIQFSTNGAHCRLLLKTSKTAKVVALDENRKSSESGERYWHIHTFSHAENAAAFGNALRSTFCSLNRRSEGFHVVEHVLLRPDTPDAQENHDIDDEFFSMKVSIVLPSWTTRFADHRFQQVIKETIIKTCPAHISPQFVWLNWSKMRQFERLYKAWLLSRVPSGPIPDETNVLSRLTKEFLLHHMS
ncbi:MAG: hypothetical protein JXR76_16505 [Deltaproteobacteria bacterium]|nr:hypothetical protein [Deltaproteobacteria bacterium]